MISKESIIRHDRFRQFVKEKTIGIPRSGFWQDNSSNFLARLTPIGYQNLGSANCLPLMVGRSKEEQSPNAAYTLDQNTDDLYMRHFQTAVAQWNPELKNIKIYDGKIWIGSVPLEYNASFWSALYTLYAINHFAGRYLNENSRVLEIGAGSGLDTCTFVAEFGLKSLIIDLPEVLTLSSALIMTLFPNKRICLPNEIDEHTPLEEYDFVLLLPNQIGIAKSLICDLAINTSSFMEMEINEVRRYFRLISKQLRDGSYFFCRNRDKETLLKDYPWEEFGKFELVHRAPNGVMANIPPWNDVLFPKVIDDIRRLRN